MTIQNFFRHIGHLSRFVWGRNPHRAQTLVLCVAAFVTLTGNRAFFKHAAAVYFPHSVGFLLGLAVILFALNFLLFTLIGTRRTIRWLGALLLMVSAVVAYYMDTFDVVIDQVMLTNAAQTQTREVLDLFTPKFMVYIVLLGVLPAWWLLRQSVVKTTFKKAFWAKFKAIALSLLLVAVCAGGFGKHLASFAREHKAMRFYTNPLTYLYSAGQFVTAAIDNKTRHFEAIGTDATIEPNKKPHTLMVLVVGETARADHWSLNGYGKNTNPLLAQEPDAVSLTQLSSCGTSTAVSVPCMFTNLGRDGYSERKFNSTENVLDVLKRAGVEILWRDNNSSSKGVAERVPYQDYQTAQLNPICDVECRDEGMLVGLPEFIKQHADHDILIILHTMGSHGPAYFKRYPKPFERFTPACQDNQLENCSQEAISNAFDNTIVYTDYVLEKTIALLKTQQNDFATAMIYLSDHGESLGENGVYLHGLPYAIAPEAQKHPAALLWVGQNFKGLNAQKLRTIANQPLSHDNLFDTLLGGFGVKTSIYRPQMDIFKLAGGN